MTRDEGFVAFYREYTQTWLHGVATAALTAFGMLTFVNRLFAVVAIAAYVVPPIVQYVRGPTGEVPGSDDAEPEGTTEEATTPADDAASRDGETAETAGGGGGVRTEEAGDTEETDGTTGLDTSRESDVSRESRATDESDESGEPDEPDDTEEDGTDDADEPRWTAADAPTDATLLDAAASESEAYAVGAGGVVLGREGEEWTVLLEDGPGAGSNDLRGVATAGDGGVWVAGDGGAVGRIDPETGRHTDYSAPDGDTSNISAVAAAGEGGTETVLLADGSGRVRRGRYRDDELAWEDPTKPGSGSSVAAVELRGDDGAFCDTAGGVFRTTDGGRSFDALAFEAEGTPTDVTEGGGTLLVADDDGAVHRYDGSRWTPERVADGPLLALSTGDAGGVAVGESKTYERFGSADWTRAETPALGSLRGVAVDGEDAVAVGDDGTVVERSED